MSFDPVLFDLGMAPLERGWLRRWRREAMGLLGPAGGDWRLLDVGVGTGANLGLYPEDARVTAIDLDPAMLERARRKGRSGSSTRTSSAARADRLELREMDVTRLDFPDASFDAALATLVFCEVEDPVAGLREILRVLRPGGRLVMLEHTLTGRPVVDRILSALTALTARSGEHLDRDTAAHVREAGFEAVETRRLGLLVFHLIAARKPAAGA